MQDIQVAENCPHLINNRVIWAECRNKRAILFRSGFMEEAGLYAESSEIFDRRALPRRGRGYRGFKTLADAVLACVLMPIAAPIVAVLAILVRRASPGPAFYCQTRLGLHGRPFRIWKLRTMVHNCEAVTGPVWSGKNDHRVTALGRILRETHLDELPQLWNVLRGEMSLVGPRPERPGIARRIEAQVPEFGLRLLVKPGVTGLAQLRVPPDVDISNITHKLAQDLAYLRHQGPVLDLRIVVSTALHFVGTLIVCVSKTMLAGPGTMVRQEMTQIETLNLTGRHTLSISISATEPEFSEATLELSAAA